MAPARSKSVCLLLHPGDLPNNLNGFCYVTVLSPPKAGQETVTGIGNGPEGGDDEVELQIPIGLLTSRAVSVAEADSGIGAWLRWPVAFACNGVWTYGVVKEYEWVSRRRAGKLLILPSTGADESCIEVDFRNHDIEKELHPISYAVLASNVANQVSVQVLSAKALRKLHDEVNHRFREQVSLAPLIAGLSQSAFPVDGQGWVRVLSPKLDVCLVRAQYLLDAHFYLDQDEDEVPSHVHLGPSWWQDPSPPDAPLELLPIPSSGPTRRSRRTGTGPAVSLRNGPSSTALGKRPRKRSSSFSSEEDEEEEITPMAASSSAAQESGRSSSRRRLAGSNSDRHRSRISTSGSSNVLAAGNGTPPAAAELAGEAQRQVLLEAQAAQFKLKIDSLTDKIAQLEQQLAAAQPREPQRRQRGPFAANNPLPAAGGIIDLEAPPLTAGLEGLLLRAAGSPKYGFDPSAFELAIHRRVIATRHQGTSPQALLQSAQSTPEVCFEPFPAIFTRCFSFNFSVSGLSVTHFRPVNPLDFQGQKERRKNVNWEDFRASVTLPNNQQEIESFADLWECFRGLTQFANWFWDEATVSVIERLRAIASLAQAQTVMAQSQRFFLQRFVPWIDSSLGQWRVTVARLPDGADCEAAAASYCGVLSESRNGILVHIQSETAIATRQEAAAAGLRRRNDGEPRRDMSGISNKDSGLPRKAQNRGNESVPGKIKAIEMLIPKHPTSGKLACLRFLSAKGCTPKAERPDLCRYGNDRAHFEPVKPLHPRVLEYIKERMGGLKKA